MYFINNKIVKSIANEIYRDARFTTDDIEGWYVVYDSENQFKDIDFTIAFTVNRDMPDEVFQYKHFTITVIENKIKQGKADNTYVYYTTNTLNRRDLADKLLEIISRYEYLKEVA